ncbi:MAG: selenide, water dikinase SelD [Bacteroidales bacterium]|nr:selenide, water dikinase SelD [Bacteroidales bacterium]MCF8338094.1 selenide, water dikinase SelD [Bacteroidales bacterium]
MDLIYLDYNATTPVDKEVAEEMRPYLDTYFGNPSSTHREGLKAKMAVEKARSRLAGMLNCSPDEIIFTSGGTESNNYAIKGVAFANRHKGKHIITSVIEHPAVSEVCRYLEKEGFEITRLPVDKHGLVKAGELEKAIRPDTILVSIMHANNEVGSIQPIAQLAEIAHSHAITFHSDGAQSAGKTPTDMQELGVDLFSIAGHKLYAPKGIGALYVKTGTHLEKLMHGASHERNYRAGTENVLEIVGLGKAAEIAKRDLEKNMSHYREMRDLLEYELSKDIPGIRINSQDAERLPNTSSVSIPKVEANTLIEELEGIAVSAGAACHTDKVDVSSVLEAMKIPTEYAMGTIRFSTGRQNTAEEIRKATKMLSDKVKQISGEEQETVTHPASSTIKLTHYTHGMGCACKLRPQDLEAVLKNFPLPTDPNVLVGSDTSDDAAIYRINESQAVVQTLDFFTPIVDEPYHFGAIAATNALSDLYAMGGDPLFALNIVGFPGNRLPMSVLEEILQGARDKATEAGISILGGHTVEDTEPKYGMVVSGLIHPEKIIKNTGARPGDKLIITKPIGTGIISTATKRGLTSEATNKNVIELMSTLNRLAANVMTDFDVSACTDVTGFGLIGHLREMILNTPTGVTLYSSKVPVLEEAREFVTAGIVPGGTENNLDYVKHEVHWPEDLSQTERLILCDAQTSGGLLISVAENEAANMMEKMEKSDVQASIIGEFSAENPGKITVKKTG